MFGFSIRTRQNGPASPKTTGSPGGTASSGGAGTPKTTESPKLEVGEIDTRAPFQSVKAAVSLFGEGASPKAKPVVKKFKTAEERVLEKETQLHLALKELDRHKEHLKSAESSKAQALLELDKANRTLNELTNKIELISESKQAAIASSEAAKQRLKQFEAAKSSQPQAGGNAWKQDVDNEREQYKSSAAELIAAKQELTTIRQDFDAALEEKLAAIQTSADAQHVVKINQERLIELPREISKMRERLEHMKLSSAQAQEEQSNVMFKKAARINSLKNAKEEVGKKILSLKAEQDLENDENLEEKLEETTEAIGVLREQLKNVKAMDLESLRTATSELEDAKKKLQEVSGEEASLRTLLDSLKLELETVKRDRCELTKKEAEKESAAQNLRRELEKGNADLEAARVGESESGNASNDLLQEIQKLTSESENARREAAEMSRQGEELKQETESARIAAKEAEERLEVALREAAEAKAAEKLAGDQIHGSSSAGAKSANDKNSEFNNRIKLSVEEYETLSRKAEQFESMAEAKVAAAMAQVKEISAREEETIKKLKASLEEIERMKAATEEALKRADMDDAAKQAIEGELQKRRQQEGAEM